MVSNNCDHDFEKFHLILQIITLRELCVPPLLQNRLDAIFFLSLPVILCSILVIRNSFLLMVNEV